MGTNGLAKVTEKKKFSLGQYKDRKAAGKAPAKTTPLPAAAAAGTGFKNYPVTTGDKKLVFFLFFFFSLSFSLLSVGHERRIWNCKSTD